MDGQVVFGANFDIRIQGVRVEAALGEEVEDLDDGAVGAVFNGDDGVVVGCVGRVGVARVRRRALLDGGEYGGERGKRVQCDRTTAGWCCEDFNGCLV
jgi:hypothetical protein